MVRDLTPSECGELLVHCHTILPERRNALLFKRGPAKVYFNDAEIEAIKAWIEQEDYLPQDSKLADHPKRETHWCDYCGHVEHCEHDEKRQQRSKAAADLEEARAEIKRLKAELARLQRTVAEACRTVAIDHGRD